ncbi:CLAVATA3/ESR (CLE)-related protein [Salix suchowensis]|nr:CLAVATA3/ESR (CLE)-related protein [Salix suchowensis]
MDIDPFWITGGCFIITDLNFMATARSLSVFENTAKLQAMVLFLGLLLIVPLLARPVDLSKNSQLPQSKYKPPSGTTAAAAAAMTSSGTTTTVSATPGSASNHQFKAAFHEVPSGPNPESN